MFTEQFWASSNNLTKFVPYLSTDLSLTFPRPLRTSAMFGKLHPDEVSVEFRHISGARDNRLALFCSKKLVNWYFIGWYQGAMKQLRWLLKLDNEKWPWQPLSHGSTMAPVTLSSQWINLCLPSVTLRRGWVRQREKKALDGKQRQNTSANNSGACTITITADQQSFPSQLCV